MRFYISGYLLLSLSVWSLLSLPSICLFFFLSIVPLQYILNFILDNCLYIYQKLFTGSESIRSCHVYVILQYFILSLQYIYVVHITLFYDYLKKDNQDL